MTVPKDTKAKWEWMWEGGLWGGGAGSGQNPQQLLGHPETQVCGGAQRRGQGVWAQGAQLA